MSQFDQNQLRKLYASACVVSYLVRQFNPGSNWHNTFKTAARKLPVFPGVVEHHVLGFPADWEEWGVWN